MNYDALIITNLPNYYKTNLFNEISKLRKIHVIYIAGTMSGRNNDFLTNQGAQFDFTVLAKSFERRNVLNSCWNVFRLIRKHDFGKVILGEWVSIEYWWTNLLFKRKNTYLMLESSIDSISGIGFRERAKQLFLSGVGLIFANGTKHEQLARFLGFQRRILNSRGLGIINYGDISPVEKSGDYLYVGRLSPEKNLKVLLEVFATRKEKLTIVGEGPMEAELKAMASDNVKLSGYVPNKELTATFKSHRALILISTHEPYGLVGEEAMFYGTPAIVSSVCGIVDTLCFHDQNCIVVNARLHKEIHLAIDQMNNNKYYNKLVENCGPEKILTKNKEQVRNYVETLP